MCTDPQPTSDAGSQLAQNNASFSLLLPGKVLYLSVLLMQTKFKSCGKKAGAIARWKLLHDSGLASMVEFKAQKGTDKVSNYIACVILIILSLMIISLYKIQVYELPIPEEAGKKMAFVEKLLKFNVSIQMLQCKCCMFTYTVLPIMYCWHCSGNVFSPKERLLLCQLGSLHA